MGPANVSVFNGEAPVGKLAGGTESYIDARIHHQKRRRHLNGRGRRGIGTAASMEEKGPRGEGENEEAAVAEGMGWCERRWRGRGAGGGGVMLEGYVVGRGERGPGGFAMTRNLTDEDLEELKGCLDLGFGFNYEEIPELCNTLPALELCYSMSQMLHLDDHHQQQQVSAEDPPPVANWRISSPGDDPDEVKARLKYWAQAVACTLRLCS